MIQFNDHIFEMGWFNHQPVWDFSIFFCLSHQIVFKVKGAKKGDEPRKVKLTQFCLRGQHGPRHCKCMVFVVQCVLKPWFPRVFVWSWPESHGRNDVRNECQILSNVSCNFPPGRHVAAGFGDNSMKKRGESMLVERRGPILLDNVVHLNHMRCHSLQWCKTGQWKKTYCKMLPFEVTWRLSAVMGASGSGKTCWSLVWKGTPHESMILNLQTPFSRPYRIPGNYSFSRSAILSFCSE